MTAKELISLMQELPSDCEIMLSCTQPQELLRMTNIDATNPRYCVLRNYAIANPRVVLMNDIEFEIVNHKFVSGHAN